MKIKPEVLEYAHKRLAEICFNANASDFALGIIHELLSIIHQGIMDYRKLLEFEAYAQKRFEEADEMLSERNKIINELKKKLERNS